MKLVIAGGRHRVLASLINWKAGGSTQATQLNYGVLMSRLMSYHKAMKLATAKGIVDPEVKCEIHNVTIKHSELSETALICLEEGLDTTKDLECLLLCKD